MNSNQLRERFEELNNELLQCVSISPLLTHEFKTDAIMKQNKILMEAMCELLDRTEESEKE